MLAWPDGRVRPLLFDGSPLLPSAVCVEPDGRLLTGRDAMHAARVDPARFEGSPKRRVDDGTVLLGERELGVPVLVAAVLARVGEEATRVAGAIPTALTLTHPAQWGVSRRLLLVEAAQAAGLPQPRLVPEPVAAATYFTEVLGQRLAPGSGVVVYDFGAGTFDASVVGRGGAGLEVLAVDGIDDLGGLDLDALLVEYARSHTPSADWSHLDRPQTPEDRRQRRLLWEEARLAKEMLSRSESVTLQVPGIGDVLITRSEFERVARPLLDQTVRTTAAVLRWSRLASEQVAGVFLVGGASRVPLVATLLHRELGVPPTVIEQPELVVAEGSLHQPGRRAPASSSLARAATPVGQASPVGQAARASQTPATPATPASQTSAMPASETPTAPITPVRAVAPISAQPVSPQTPYPSSPVPYPVSPQAAYPSSPPPAHPVVPAWRPPVPQQAPVPQPQAGPRRRPALAFVAGGVAALVLVAAVIFGRPFLDRIAGADSNGGSSGGPTTGPATTQPATTPASAPATTAAPYQRKMTPEWLPAGWRLVVDQPAGKLWHDQDETEGGRCSIVGDDLHVTRGDVGIVGCSILDPLNPRWDNVAFEVEVTVDRGCAGLWTRTGNRGYFLTVCRDVARFYLLGDEPPSSSNQLARWSLPASPRRLVVGVLANGDRFDVYAAGQLLGTVTDATLRIGHVNAGGFTDASDSKIDVTFHQFRVWLP